MQQTNKRLYQGVIAPRRIEYKPFTNENEPEESECPICQGAKLVSQRIRYGVFEYPACLCTTAGVIESKRRYANMPRDERWLSQFKFVTPEAEAAWQACNDLALDFGAWPTPMLTLAGGVGTGKSHLLQGIGRIAVESGITTKYIYVPDWLEELRATFDSQGSFSFDETYAPLREATLLLLDDLGAERQTQFTRETLGRVVDYRYREGLQTVIATNVVPFEQDAPALLGDRLADRIFDENSGKVSIVYTGSVSYRTATTKDMGGR